MTSSNTFVRRHKNAIGFRLFKFGHRQFELWFCPAGFDIGPHNHPRETIEIYFLYGKDIIFHRTNMEGREHRIARLSWPKDFRKHFTTGPKHIHWAEKTKSPLIFLSVQRWTTKPTSAAEDFIPIKELYATEKTNT